MPASSNGAHIIGWCALAMILSLYVVGTVSHGVIRHIVQTATIWPAVWLGMKRSDWTKWVALPSCVIWLALMVLIWLFLLGWAKVIDGTFSPIEIAMTVIVGVAAAAAVATSLRTRTAVSWAAGLGTLALMACLQIFALWLSFRPHISRDPW